MKEGTVCLFVYFVIVLINRLIDRLLLLLCVLCISVAKRVPQGNSSPGWLGLRRRVFHQKVHVPVFKSSCQKASVAVIFRLNYHLD